MARIDSFAGTCGDGTRACFVEQRDDGSVAEAPVARMTDHFARHVEAQTTETSRLTSMLPRVAFEYGTTWCA
jgi:hypothetical protein